MKITVEKDQLREEVRSIYKAWRRIGVEIRENLGLGQTVVSKI